MLRYIRQWNDPDLQKYMEDPTGIMDGEDLTEEQVVIERVMLALRTCDGIEEEYLLAHCAPVRIDQALASGDLVRIPASPGAPEPYSSGIPVPAGPYPRLRIPEDRFFVSDMIIADLI